MVPPFAELDSTLLQQRGGFVHILEHALEYGEHILLHHPKHPSHVLNHPRYVTQVLRAPQHFGKLGATGRASGLSQLLGQGILTNPDPHSAQQQRRMLQPYFTRARMHAELPALFACLQTWLVKQADSIDLYPAMLHLSQHVMYQLLFGIAPPPSALQIPLELATAPAQRQRQARAEYLRILHDHLAQQPAGICPHLADMPPQARDDALLTLLAAGLETSAAALSWTLALLCQHPLQCSSYQAAINEQAAMHLHRLPHVRHTFAEALRLYPTIPLLPRVALHDCSLEGVPVVAGARVFINLAAIHRHPDYWQQPSDFMPTRFATRPAPHSYLPLGYGQRMCLGMHLALLMGEALLPRLLQWVTPVAPPHRPPGMAGMPTLRLAISLQPKGAYRLKLKSHA